MSRIPSEMPASIVCRNPGAAVCHMIVNRRVFNARVFFATCTYLFSEDYDRYRQEFHYKVSFEGTRYVL